jgi:hypothetical protein
MTAEYKARDPGVMVRDPFFADGEPTTDAGEAAERWVAALKLAGGIDQRLPGILIDMASGCTMETAGRRSGVPKQTVSRWVSILRAKRNAAMVCRHR